MSINSLWPTDAKSYGDKNYGYDNILMPNGTKVLPKQVFTYQQ